MKRIVNEEVILPVKFLKRGNAVGHDGFTSEMVQCLGNGDLKCNLSCLIIIYGKLEQRIEVTTKGCNVPYIANNDVNMLQMFNHMCGIIRRTLKSIRIETYLIFYKVIALPTLPYGSENWIVMKSQASCS